jgi:hypothetical protein
MVIIEKTPMAAHYGLSFVELGGFDRYKIVYSGFSNRDRTAVSY